MRTGSLALTILAVMLAFASVFTFLFEIRGVSTMDSLYLLLFGVVMASIARIYNKVSAIHDVIIEEIHHDTRHTTIDPFQKGNGTTFYSTTITPDANGIWQMTDQTGVKQLDNIIQNMLNNMNSNVTSNGDRSIDEQIAILESKKQEALKKEDYEYVAELQKKIETLQNEGGEKK